MAYIELNALSVCLSGTFESCIFMPESRDLQRGKAFPVIWYIPEDGDSPYGILKYANLLEQLAVQKKYFIIASAVSHSLCTDMVWGTKNETFLSKECVEIFRFLYPLSSKPEENIIMGIGTGAYGACKLALHHPDMFGTGIAIEGELDLAAQCESLQKGQQEKEVRFPFQSRASLEAIFGDLGAVAGSRNDLFVAAKESAGKLRLLCGKDSPVYRENTRLAELNPNIKTVISEDSEDEKTLVEKLLMQFCKNVP